MGGTKPTVASVRGELALLLCALEEAEARIEEVDLRTTSLAIGQGNISAALDRTEALVALLDGLEARAVVLEAAYAGREKPPPPWQYKAATWLRERAARQREARTAESERTAHVLEVAADEAEAVEDDLPW